MGKYSLLKDFFSEQAEDSITLSFDQIEKIINNRLPNSAFTSEAWWNKRNAPQSEAWINAGYDVSINLEDKKAEFKRNSATSRVFIYTNEIDEFYHRWNISKEVINDNEFLKFKNRILTLITPYVRKFYLNNIDSEFCLIAGIKYKFKFDDPFAPSARLYQFNVDDSMIYLAFNDTNSKIKIIYLLQILFLVLFNEQQFSIIAQLLPQLEKILYLSPSMGVEISNFNNKVVLYPSGAKLLDEKIINKDLQWLNEYPDVYNLFEKSLIDYLNFSGDNAEGRSILDGLRASFEQLLKVVLNNDKPLEKNAKEIKDWMKTKNIHPNIRNSVGIYSHLDNYIYFMNDVKHPKQEINYTKSEIEHMIYQTGIFIRLIIETEKNN